MSRLQLVHKGPRHENKAHENFSLALEPAASEEINFPPTSEDSVGKTQAKFKRFRKKEREKKIMKERNGSSNSPRMICFVFISPQKMLDGAEEQCYTSQA